MGTGLTQLENELMNDTQSPIKVSQHKPNFMLSIENVQKRQIKECS